MTVAAAAPDPLDASVRGLAMIDDPASLDEGLRLLRLAVRHTSASDPARPGRLLNLGVAVDRRWERDHELTDLTEAINLYRQVAASTDAGADVTAACLANLCHALRVRYGHTGARPDLDAAVVAGAACLDVTAVDDDRRVDRLEQVAHALRERYENGHDVGDLAAALGLYREAALRSTPPDGTEPTGRALVHLRNYILAARDHHAATGDVCTASAAVAPAFRLAGDPEAASLVQWAARLAISGVDADGPRQAAAALRRAVELAEGPDADTLRLDLVAALRRYGNRTGRADEVRAAVDAAYEAVDLAGADGRAPALGALGAAQICLHRHTGVPAHLDDAIRSLRQANLAASGTDGTVLANLSVALTRRYETFADLADLDKAVTLSRGAAALAPPDDDDRGAYATNVAHALQRRYERFWRRADIDEAIAVQRTVLGAADPRSALAAMAEANLGITYRYRFLRLRQPDDLDEAVRRSRSALKSFRAQPDGNRAVGQEMVNLAVTLGDRYRYLHRTEALDEAVDLAVRAVPLLDGARYALRGRAAMLLVDRFRRDGRETDAHAAIRYLSDLARNPTVSTTAQVDAAVAWGRLAEDRGDRVAATTAFGEAVAALTRLPCLGTSRRAREQALALAGGLAGDAGAAALEVGDADSALDRIERGRGVLWTQQLELLGDLTRLAGVDPVLAARLEAIGRELAGNSVRHLVPDDPSAGPRVLDLLDEAGRAADYDIDRAVSLIREAVEAAPHDLLAIARATLSNTLLRRHRARGERADLDDAVEAAEAAVRAAPVGASGRYWSWYGHALLRRYDADRDGGEPDPAVLDSAVRAFTLAATAGRSPRDRADDLAALATARDRKCDDQADEPALSAAVEAWRDALRASARDGVEQAEWTGSLALALLQRCNLTGSLVDLDEAIDRLDAATGAGDDDDLVERHYWRSLALRTRWQARGERADLDAALTDARRAAELSVGLDQETRDMVQAALNGTQRMCDALTGRT